MKSRTTVMKELADLHKNSEIISAPVEGMTCASCVARVEKSISKIEGIKNVSVNLATEKASFEIEAGLATLPQVERAVEDAGYKIDFSSINKKAQAVSNQIQPDSKIEYDNDLKKDFLLALILSIPILLLNMGMMWDGFHNFVLLSTDVINRILLVLTTPVVFISGKRFYKIFWKNLMHFNADMNSLVAIGTGSAFIFSTLITLFPEIFSSEQITSHVYFDTAAVIITLILMGRWLESRAKSKTGSAIKKLIELKPKNVTVLRNSTEEEIDLDDLLIGDIAVVKPGGKIPADGKIKGGFSTIDESMITGESIPVEKSAGSKVIGGTINKTGSFEFEVTAIGNNSVLGQIIKMVEEAQGSKAPIQKLADKIAAVFVPVIILIAITTFLGWLFLGSGGLNTALINFVAVLIIACPCALGLATPTAIIVGTGKGAQNGILIKNAESLEVSYKIDTIIFDKTGTITTGRPKVSSVYTNRITEEELLRIAGSLEQRSEHPLAQAIVSYTKNNGINLDKPDTFESLTGTGLKGLVNGNEVLIGSSSLMENNSINISEFETTTAKLSEGGKSFVFISINKILKGLIALEDETKSNAKEVVDKLKTMKLKTVLLTGDNNRSAKNIAEKVGFDNFNSEVLPGDKNKIVSEYQNNGRIVAMVGDGINDAPALTQSNIGIAMGTGTDVAIESADIVLISGDLNGVIKSINLSRLTLKTIKQNLFWAFIYNIIGVPLAAFGLLNPMIAALAMSFSSVSVVSNSLRLKGKKL
ncbi:MAG: heavy metal translocating P-type ATPase [Ignavibacteriaceae bacterium]